MKRRSPECELRYYFGRKVSPRAKRYIVRHMRKDYNSPPRPLLTVLSRGLSAFQAHLRNFETHGTSKIQEVQEKEVVKETFGRTTYGEENDKRTCHEEEILENEVYDVDIEAELPSTADNGKFHESEEEEDYSLAEELLQNVLRPKLQHKAKYVARKLAYDPKAELACLLQYPERLEEVVSDILSTKRKRRIRKRRRSSRGGALVRKQKRNKVKAT